MTPSPHWAPAVESDLGDDVEFDLLVDESASTGATAWAPPTPPGATAWTASHESDQASFDDDLEAEFDGRTGGSAEILESHPLSATEYATAAGTPGRGVIVSAAIGTAAAAVLDLALVGRLSFFFDVTFIVMCLAAAMAVRPRDLFTAAVLPPLAFAGAIGGVALIWPHAIAATGGFSKIFLTGLAAHAGGLVGGYAAALLTVAARVYARRQA